MKREVGRRIEFSSDSWELEYGGVEGLKLRGARDFGSGPMKAAVCTANGAIRHRSWMTLVGGQQQKEMEGKELD